MPRTYNYQNILSILNRLDRNEKVTTYGLMLDFGKTRRSIERYFSMLRNAGFPITYDRIARHYKFDKGYHLGHAQFTAEESLVFGLAKSMLKQFGGKPSEVLETIAGKISIRDTALPQHIILGEGVLPPKVGERLDQLHHAIEDRRLVEINYRATYKNDEATCRIVEPYYLLFKENMWYLRGYCRLREETRTFALDKIESLSVKSKHFVKNNEILPNDELAGAFHVVLDGDPVDVVLRFDAKVKPYLLRQKWLPNQENNELSDGRLEVRLRVNGFAGLKPWVYRWIPYVEVVKPREFQKMMVNDLFFSMNQNTNTR